VYIFILKNYKLFF